MKCLRLFQRQGTCKWRAKCWYCADVFVSIDQMHTLGRCLERQLLVSVSVAGLLGQRRLLKLEKNPYFRWLSMALELLWYVINFSGVSSGILFLMYYYMCLLAVTIRLLSVFIWAWYVLLTDCIIVLSPVYCDIIGANKIDDDDDDDITVLD